MVSYFKTFTNKGCKSPRKKNGFWANFALLSRIFCYRCFSLIKAGSEFLAFMSVLTLSFLHIYFGCQLVSFMYESSVQDLIEWMSGLSVSFMHDYQAFQLVYCVAIMACQWFSSAKLKKDCQWASCKVSWIDIWDETNFHCIGPLGRFGLVVAMSVRPHVCVGTCPLPMRFFSRSLIGPQVTWPDPRPLIGQKNVLNSKKNI